tara:strand:+ start:4332 stop:4781 length:450 start_codon:yes stop_codon:yes gene_type:complete
MTLKEANELVARISTVLDINIHNLKSKSRKADIILERRAFMKLLSETGMTTKNVGSVFNQSHSNVICSNKKHNDFVEIRDKEYLSVFEKIKKEFILRADSLDNAIHSLLEILMTENSLRHDELISCSRKNKKLKKEIQYLKDQLNMLNK